MVIDGNSVSFYWSDLTEETQKQFEEFFGDNGNYDIFPFCTLEFEKNT